ncbi:MAG: hypothetical protein J5518_03295 [Lachnospiraceae bacterium]|nr:hypothetical protein [Lachnospiraceae bacterium]
MLKITTDRTIDESYLVIEEQDDKEQGLQDAEGVLLETHMLTENRMASLLPLKQNYIDGRISYRYPVTGKTPLKQLYDRTGIRAEMMRNLIGSIRTAFQCAEEYLIDTGHILLDPAYIYYSDQNDHGFFLCCCPLWSVPVQTGMQELAEYLITITDHSDDCAIDLAYGFYKQIMTGDLSMDRLLATERAPAEKVLPVHTEREEQDRNNRVSTVIPETPHRKTGSLGVLGFATVFALVLCFTMCLLLLKFH